MNLKPHTEADQDRLALACLVTLVAVAWIVFPTCAFFLARILP